MTMEPTDMSRPMPLHLWGRFVLYVVLNLSIVMGFAIAAWLSDPVSRRPDRTVAVQFMDGLRFGNVVDDQGQTGYECAARLLTDSFCENQGVVRLVEDMDDLVAANGLIISCKPRESDFGNHVHRQIVFDVECARSEGETESIIATVSLCNSGGNYLVEGLTWSFDS